MSITVSAATVDDPGLLDLLATHLATMHEHTPPALVFALDADALRRPGVSLFVLRDGDELIGCGAVAAIDERHAELKSMHVRVARRGQGLAGHLIAALEDHARAQGIERLSLETGVSEAYAAARALYARHGYEACGPFARYVDNGHSAFFTKRIDGEARP